MCFGNTVNNGKHIYIYIMTITNVREGLLGNALI